MAKHKPINQILIAGLGIGVMIAVIVPVMIFVFGVGFNTLPQQPNQPFQIPIISNCEVGETETENGCTPIIPIEDIDEPVGVDFEIPIETPQEIIFIQPITSNDTTTKQVIEQIIPPKTIKLEANIAKIDSSSKIYVESFSFDIKPFSLFVEDTSNIDFAKGFVELGLNLVYDPNNNLVANGMFNILINNKTVFPQDITLKVDGITDSDGKIKIKFADISDLYTFDFGANIQKFPNEAVSKIQYIIKSLEITTDKEYGLFNQEIFSMDIFRDDIKVLITNSDGTQVRTNLQDSTLKITSNPSTIATAYTSRTQCPYGGNPAPSTTYYGVTNVPAIPIAVKIIDTDTGQTIDAFSGTGTVVDIKLFRNHNYTIDHNVVDKPRSKDPFIISTPKTQANFNYNVWTDSDYSSSSGGSGSSGLCTVYTTISTPIIGTQHVKSNFPK